MIWLEGKTVAQAIDEEVLTGVIVKAILAAQQGKKLIPVGISTGM